MFRPEFFTSKVLKFLPYFFLQLSHCHVLKLLLGSAQVDHHLVTPESTNNNLVVPLHFVLTCVSLAVFLKLLARTLVMALQVVVHDLGLTSDEWRYSSTVIIGGIEGVTSKGWKNTLKEQMTILTAPPNKFDAKLTSYPISQVAVSALVSAFVKWGDCVKTRMYDRSFLISLRWVLTSSVLISALM